MTMKDHSYLGSGKVWVREYGAAAPFVDIGNCSALSFSPQTNVIELADHTQPGGGMRNSVGRLTGVEMGVTFHDFAASNLAIFLRSNATAVVAGTVTAEEVVGYKGGLTPLAKVATGITTVTNIAGTTTYVAGTDYEFMDGGIFIPATSSITAPVAGAANLKVTYANAAQQVVQALTSAGKHYEVLFVGLNEAQSGKRVQVRAHKVAIGVLQQWGLIAESHGAGEVTSKLLSDSSKGAGESAYFKAVLEDVA